MSNIGGDVTSWQLLQNIKKRLLDMFCKILRSVNAVLFSFSTPRCMGAEMSEPDNNE
jgi:hypothetical protein